MNCPACGNDVSLVEVRSINNYKMFRCGACDVEFADPMKNPGADWYEKSELYSVGKIIDSGVGWNHRQFLELEKKYGLTLLDIGCGTGAFLHEARKLGYQPCGIDFDTVALKVAGDRFVLPELFQVNVSELSKLFPERRFDVISFFEVLEHVENPAVFLSQVSQLLAPSGLIAVSVPNRNRKIDFMKDDDYPPNHLTRWTAESLSSFFRSQGYEILTVVQKRVDLREIVAYLHATIRLGLAKRLVVEGASSGKGNQVSRGARLLKIKNALFYLIASVAFPVLYISRLQGSTIFCLARKK